MTRGSLAPAALLEAARDRVSFLAHRHVWRVAPNAARATLESVATAGAWLRGVPVVYVQGERADPPIAAVAVRNAPTREDVIRRVFASFVAAPDDAVENRPVRAAAFAELAGDEVLPDAPALLAADLAFALVPRWRAALFRRAGYFILPMFVRQSVDLTQPEARLFASRDARRTVDAIDKEKYESAVVYDTGSLHEFYESMYRPSLERRHAGRAIVRSERYLSYGLAHGALVFVLSRGRRVAAALNVTRVDSSVTDNWVGGVLAGDPSWLQRHADAATYLFSIRWARDVAGCRSLGLSVTRPFLRDGLFRFKRKWGAHVQHYEAVSEVLAFRVNRASPRAVRFLERQPFIFENARHELSGLALAIDAAVGWTSLGTEGLSALWAVGPRSAAVTNSPEADPRLRVVACDDGADALAARLHELAVSS